MEYRAMWTQPGRAEKACIKDAGPERKRWVNNSGYTWGAGVTERDSAEKDNPKG